jgi:hypothetical protein
MGRQTAAMDAEIDEHVYSLYRLKAEEIKTVEST